MSSSDSVKNELVEFEINVKIKLAALWTSLMFLYVYVDIVGFFKPGTIEDILAGKVWEFDITQAWALSALVLMSIPSAMIFLSVILDANINRKLNIVMAVFHFLLSIGNAVGESWVYFYYGAIVEAVICVLILRHALNWPTEE